MSYERGWGNLEGNSTKDVLEFDRVLALPVATNNNATSHAMTNILKKSIIGCRICRKPYILICFAFIP